jgi:hypothetical protein
LTSEAPSAGQINLIAIIFSRQFIWKNLFITNNGNFLAVSSTLILSYYVMTRSASFASLKNKRKSHATSDRCHCLKEPDIMSIPEWLCFQTINEWMR